MPPPRYRVVFRQAPPFRIRFGPHHWRVDYEYYGKNGCKSWLVARCSDGREIVILDGRERAVSAALKAIATQPGTLMHELWVRLARCGAIALVEEPRPVERPTGTYLDCGKNVFVPLGRKRARDLTGQQIQRLCAAARAKAQRA